jgi:hypothetical protein
MSAAAVSLVATAVLGIVPYRHEYVLMVAWATTFLIALLALVLVGARAFRWDLIGSVAGSALLGSAAGVLASVLDSSDPDGFPSGGVRGRSSVRSCSVSSGSSSIPPSGELTTPSLDGSRRRCPASRRLRVGASRKERGDGSRPRVDAADAGRSVQDPRSEPAIRGMRAQVRLWSTEAARLRHRPARVVVRVASSTSTRGPPTGSRRIAGVEGRSTTGKGLA